MNILQILPELRVGGVETGTVDLSGELVKLGHKAVVVSAGGELVAELERMGVKHYTLPVHKKSLLSIISLIPKLEKIIREEKIDIVHARSRVPGWIAFFASRRAKAVFITTCHGYYRKHFFSSVMGWGKRVIVLSQAIGRHMIEDFSVPHERIRFVPRSVNLSRFKFIPPDKKRGEEFNVGIIGRLTPIKGHLHFIKAMAKVARVSPRLKIWIVGDAPPSKEKYKEQVQILVRRLGLWHCTEFLGTQRDIPQVLTQLDALVLATTTQEAFGRVIIEAQAAGVPVVATEVGGVVDVVEHEKTGLLVPASDPNAIADAVIRIYKDKELAATLSSNAYKKVKEKYNLPLMIENTLNVYKDALEHQKALIIKFSSLGDVILSTAAIKAIREKFPFGNYRITFLVGEEAKEPLLGCPYIDELKVCDFRNKDKGLKGLLRWGKILAKDGFDLVIDLQNNRRSHILSRLTFSQERYGYDNGKFSSLLNHRVKNDLPLLNPLQHQFRILKMLGIELSGEASLELWPTEEDGSFADELLKSEWISPAQAIVGINISASPRWLTKNWPLESIARLCEKLSERKIRVLLTGTEKDLVLVDRLSGMLKNIKPINTCGKTSVNQLASIIKRCSVYISPDSASLHIASAMQVPFIALFGPTDPVRHLLPSKKYAVLRKELDCSPCYRSKCKNPKCMELIRHEEVLEEIDRLLK